MVARATIIGDGYMPGLMRQINAISRCAGLFRSERLRDTDIGACHQSYFLAICHHPGISQEELSRHIYINKSNVTRNLSYLEEHGYVFRCQSKEDRRVTLVYPTEKMKQMLPHIEKMIGEWNALLTEDISPEELSAFSKTLDRLADRAKRYTENGGELGT